MVSNHSSSIDPVHNDRSLKRFTILRKLSQCITRGSRAFYQLRCPPTIVKDALQLVRRGRRLCNLELEWIPSYIFTLFAMVRSLIFGCSCRGIRRGLFKDIGCAYGGWDGWLVKEGYNVECLTL